MRYDKVDFSKGEFQSTVPPDTIIERLREFVKCNHGRRVFYCRNFEEVAELLGIDASPVVLDGSQPLTNASSAAHMSNVMVMINYNEIPTLKTDIYQYINDRANPFFVPYQPKEA